jgi:hypothetical protein
MLLVVFGLFGLGVYIMGRSRHLGVYRKGGGEDHPPSDVIASHFWPSHASP